MQINLHGREVGADLNDSRSGMLFPFRYAIIRDTPAPFAN